MVRETASSTLLSDLGILGWESREPVILAALATEAPLLLVGPHGAAKSLLLERLAEALGLRLRHYNASTLNFDDLVGFPVPDGDRVRYLRTPLDAWDAEAVFLDEINRCRPDMQNRLFPLVHERRLQGEKLPNLRHRWAAMNPPPAPDADPDEAAYVGAERLDAALADRFPWVVSVPALPSGAARIALIRGVAKAPEAAARLMAAVTATQARLHVTEAVRGAGVAAYIDVLADVFERSRVPMSGRRLRSLYEGIIAVLATAMVPEPRDAALLALTWSLPQRASGHFDEDIVITAHTSALRFLKDPTDKVFRRLLAEHDPVKRIAITLASTDDDLVAVTVLDARASLDPAERIALSATLFPLLVASRPGLPGILFEALAEEMSRLHALTEHSEALYTTSARYALAGQVSRTVAGLSKEEHWITEVVWCAFKHDLLKDPDALVQFARHVRTHIPLTKRAA